MQKNTLWAIVLSMLFIIVWWTVIAPPSRPPSAPQTAPASQAEVKTPPVPPSAPVAPGAPAVPEQDVSVETDNYRAVFTTRGAAIKHWYLKEKNGELVDLVMTADERLLSTLPGSDYAVSRPDPRTVVFTHLSPLGFKIVKTYTLSDEYLHSLSISLSRARSGAALPAVALDLGPGLGTTESEQKENAGQIRALGYTLAKPRELQKFKPGDYPANQYQWVGIDNRYFLSALIPADSAQFATVAVSRTAKKAPPELMLSTLEPKDAAAAAYAYDVRFYFGPKGHERLAALGLNLEESVDFGFFGFLGKIALAVLQAFYKLTGNYGWAIILLTVLLQIIVLPLTIKSFKASAAMKQLQPHIRTLQEKYKGDPQRLNMEMLNLYKTQKVNPLGGCLPMLLQLPIFWALFTTLRNAYELRGAPWILWVNDLSAPDTLMMIGSLHLNVLPLIMGVGMFVQQKMMSVSVDPAQQKLMYFMPVIFTFMFWGFPSGLVIYWLTNSVLTIIEQYVIMRRSQ